MEIKDCKQSWYCIKRNLNHLKILRNEIKQENSFSESENPCCERSAELVR
jgi:hypothetical protein